MAPGKMQVIDNPVEALVAVGKENSDIHEELARVYAELDLYRNALTAISGITGEPHSKKFAQDALAQRRVSA